MTRQEAMIILARAPMETLRGAWEAWAAQPEAQALRGPESGMIMLRGRMGGGGSPFNLGETTVSRATVQLDSGEVGFSCIHGRDLEKARLVALFDGLWQRKDDRDTVEVQLLAPLAANYDAEDRQTREEAAATKVNFFTMVRGEDE